MRWLHFNCLLVSPSPSGGCRYGYVWVEMLQRWFVLIEETHWPKFLPANSCRRPGGGSGKGKGSGRVWPYVQLQPGKEMVKHRCHGEPCDWRVDRNHGHCIFQPKSWGDSKELVGVNRLGKPEEEAVHGVLGTPCCRMC